jgi:hypothetical protein
MISLREFLVRNRSRMALVAIIGALAFLVAFEHSGLGHDQPHGDGMGDLAAMCLAIAEVAAVALLAGSAVPGLARDRHAWPAASVPDPTTVSARTELCGPSARAGPPLLCVFRR